MDNYNQENYRSMEDIRLSKKARKKRKLIAKRKRVQAEKKRRRQKSNAKKKAQSENTSEKPAEKNNDKWSLQLKNNLGYSDNFTIPLAKNYLFK